MKLKDLEKVLEKLIKKFGNITFEDLKNLGISSFEEVLANVW